MRITKTKLQRASGKSLPFLLLGLLGSLGCQEVKVANPTPELADFTSDGCSMFIDGTFEKPELWKECCLLHDMAYWRGGTEEEEEEKLADQKLEAYRSQSK